MGFGRFLCVALPFALTLLSILCILISMLSGVTGNHTLEMFDINTKNLSISSSSLHNLANELKKRGADAEPEAEADAEPANTSLGKLTSEALENDAASTVTAAIGGANFSAAQLGLADSYKVFMWNFCSTTGSKSNCTKAKFNWASHSLNVTALNEKASTISLAATGVNATFPKEITTALKTYIVVSKWTQIVYSIAFVLSVITLISGLFGFCSRAGSCFTYFLSGLATTAIIVASLMATLSAAVVVAAIKASAHSFKVTASINRNYLSVTWLAVAFSIGSGLFWLFSVCCCKAEHRHNDKRQSQKFGPSSYTPIHDPSAPTAYGHQQQQGMTYNHQMKPTGAGYEPYTHANV